MIPNSQNPRPNTLSNWLLFCCALVFAMVTVGAVTRLTGSGLSIAEWKPLMGAVPPLTEKEWHRVFALYQKSPEFLKKNSWMHLSDFKHIFFWEWLHRFLGRMIGLAYALPLAWFWLRGKLPPGYKLNLLGVLIMGGLQGALGWYMVKSGLVDDPAVSHYRLAAHLSLAFLIIACMLWLALSLRETQKHKTSVMLFMHGWAVFTFICVTICWGAFTAGLHGGFIYNDSFPKMGGAWVPPEARISLFDNPAGVQFAHRWLAIATIVMVLGFWLHAALRRNLFLSVNLMALMVLVQGCLGVATLFSGVWLPLAALHQAGALTLFMLTIAGLHRLKNL